MNKKSISIAIVWMLTMLVMFAAGLHWQQRRQFTCESLIEMVPDKAASSIPVGYVLDVYHNLPEPEKVKFQKHMTTRLEHKGTELDWYLSSRIEGIINESLTKKVIDTNYPPSIRYLIEYAFMEMIFNETLWPSLRQKLNDYRDAFLDITFVLRLRGVDWSSEDRDVVTRCQDGLQDIVESLPNRRQNKTIGTGLAYDLENEIGLLQKTLNQSR